MPSDSDTVFHMCVRLRVSDACVQVEKKGTSEQRETLLSLNDCLDLAVERCAIYFRKVEIRQTREEEMVMLLSSLEAMWEGRRKGGSAVVKTSSGGNSGKGRRGGKRKANSSSCAVSVGGRQQLAASGKALLKAAD